MKAFIQKIESIILNYQSVINEKINGTNYLEKLKYLIIDSLKDLDRSELKKLSVDLKKNNNQLKKIESEDHPTNFSINFYKDSLSTIKSRCNNDTLSIVINGLKTVSLFDLHVSKKSFLLFISRSMGLVLSENTIRSENIAPGSIILDIVYEKKTLDIEN